MVASQTEHGTGRRSLLARRYCRRSRQLAGPSARSGRVTDNRPHLGICGERRHQLSLCGVRGDLDDEVGVQQPAVADGLADQVGALGFGVAFAVFVVSRRWLASCS